MLALVITAMAWMKQKRFAAFYRIHIVFAAVTTIATLLHGFGTAYAHGAMPFSLPGAVLWVLDLLLRTIFMNRTYLTNDCSRPYVSNKRLCDQNADFCPLKTRPMS